MSDNVPTNIKSCNACHLDFETNQNVKFQQIDISSYQNPKIRDLLQGINVCIIILKIIFIKNVKFKYIILNNLYRMTINHCFSVSVAT